MPPDAQPGVPRHGQRPSRRDLLLRGGAGFGALALNYLLEVDRLSAAPRETESGAPPLAAKRPHFPATARSVVFLFMEGGPSHLDMFDPKPRLTQLAGQPLPESFGKVITSM